MLNRTTAMNVVRTYNSYGDNIELLRATLIDIIESNILDLQSNCALNSGEAQEAWTDRDWMEYEAEINTLNDKLRTANELSDAKLLQYVLGSI